MNDNNNPLNIFSEPVSNGRVVSNNTSTNNTSTNNLNTIPKEETKKGVFFQKELPKAKEESNIKRQFNPFGDGYSLQAKGVSNKSNQADNNVQNELPKTIDSIINNLNSDKTESFVMSDESLLRIYIGNKYETIINNNFNFSAFFFNAFYYVYRKMYVIGLIIFLILMSSLYITRDYAIVFVITLFTSLASGFIFNKSYIKKTSMIIQNIKSKTQNDKLKEKCIKMGKPSIINVLVLLIIFVIAIYFFLTMK